MEEMTLGEVVGIIAFILLLVNYIKEIVTIWKKPSEEVETRLRGKLKEFKAETSQDINELSEMNNLSFRVLIALLEHEVSGNHTNDMVALLNECKDYYYRKKGD